MGVLAKVIYYLVFITVIFYLAIKLKKRQYLFSVFNISCFIYLFAFAITPIFYKESGAWVALGVVNYTSYYVYLDECVLINGIGLILTYFTMTCVEFYSNIGHIKSITRFCKPINTKTINLLFPIIVFCWYALVFIFNKGLPIFNDGRTFFLHESIGIIYLLLNELILIFALFYGVKAIYSNKKNTNLIKWLICLATLFFTGSRGPVLTGVLVPVVMLFIYEYSRRRQLRNIKNVRLRNIYDIKGKWRKKTLVYIVVLLLIIGCIGVILGSARYTDNFNLITMVNELLYGNTFSDIRDGAFILEGFERKCNGEFLLGNTYLAGFLSFLPSSLVPFKTQWLYGNFTTVTLFNWTNHFGLRGGNVLEAYLNFGFVGVIIFSILQGILYGYLEKMFFVIFLQSKSNNKSKIIDKSKIYIILYFISNLINIILCTAGFYLIYFDIIFYIIITLPISSLNRRKNENNIN